MSAEIVLLKHPDIRVETNPQVVMCEAVPDEATERKMARLGFTYFSEVGARGRYCDRALQGGNLKIAIP